MTASLPNLPAATPRAEVNERLPAGS